MFFFFLFGLVCFLAVLGSIFSDDVGSFIIKGIVGIGALAFVAFVIIVLQSL